MKNGFLVAGILVISLMACKKEEAETLECIPSHLQNGLIAFYPFNNGSLQDETTLGNDLSNATTAVPASDRMGNATCAFGFNNMTSGGEFLTTTQTQFLNALPSFTISLWYQPLDNTRDGGVFESLIARGTGIHCPERRGEWSVALYDCRRAVFGHDNAVWSELISDPFVSCQDEVTAQTDVWHHAVAIKDGNNYALYMNGVLQGQQTGPADCTGAQYTAQDIGDLFVGRDFTGKIDDILIYNRALSFQEVQDLHDVTSCCK